MCVCVCVCVHCALCVCVFASLCSVSSDNFSLVDINFYGSTCLLSSPMLFRYAHNRVFASVMQDGMEMLVMVSFHCLIENLAKTLGRDEQS